LIRRLAKSLAGAAEAGPNPDSHRGTTRSASGLPLAQQRLWRFMRKPWPEKVRSVGYHWVRAFGGAPFPLRLPHGIWWIARNDAMSRMILGGTFETAERAFVDSFLQPGMTVLDVGAHHGFYSMLASRRVGPSGQVIAFEPSPRERKRLLTHLRLNRCTNVRVENIALADKEGNAMLFVVEGNDTGCNSLRPPAVAEPTRTEWVRTARLDDYLRAHGTNRVDLVKMDVEGGELATLQGATELLGRRPRPVLLCEAEDRRTGPWGYKASDISAFLRGFQYCMFVPQAGGNLTPLDVNCGSLEGNLVGFPVERLDVVSLQQG
jgi:FkbM family methyltransferase